MGKFNYLGAAYTYLQMKRDSLVSETIFRIAGLANYQNSIAALTFRIGPFMGLTIATSRVFLISKSERPCRGTQLANKL
jgi:hypothetical protein